MIAYAFARTTELWRTTTPEVSGAGCAPAPFFLTPDGVGVCVRDYADPAITAEIRADAGYVPEFPDGAPSGDGLIAAPADSKHRLVAFLEHPAERLRQVWAHRITDPVFAQQHPRRFAGIYLHPFGDFVRWVMLQDPLTCDVLVRPQWAMLPERTEYVRPRVTRLAVYSQQEVAAARLLYAADFTLWDDARGLLDALPAQCDR